MLIFRLKPEATSDAIDHLAASAFRRTIIARR